VGDDRHYTVVFYPFPVLLQTETEDLMNESDGVRSWIFPSLFHSLSSNFHQMTHILIFWRAYPPFLDDLLSHLCLPTFEEVYSLFGIRGVGGWTKVKNVT
jgi:hypothetical protein